VVNAGVGPCKPLAFILFVKFFSYLVGFTNTYAESKTRTSNKIFKHHKKREKNVRENATQISVALKSLIIVPKSML